MQFDAIMFLSFFIDYNFKSYNMDIIEIEICFHYAVNLRLKFFILFFV